MKLLLDANLSWRLISLLSPKFGHVEHVDRCGLPVPASDIAIWNWAEDNNAMIVTNDEDYYHFSVGGQHFNFSTCQLFNFPTTPKSRRAIYPLRS